MQNSQINFLASYNRARTQAFLKKAGSAALLTAYAVFVFAAPVAATIGQGTQGCTPGFWKQPQHFDSWSEPYTPADLFSSVFEDAFPGKTLLEVLGTGGGGLTALGRHTVGALLNGANPNVDYAFTAQEAIDMFNDVYPDGDYEALKNQFANANETGDCPNPAPGPTTATLIVKKHVVNDDNNGTLAASDFTMLVTAVSPTETQFVGSEDGHEVTVDPGSYSVDEQDAQGYVKTIGDGCSGVIAAGETKTCTITNNDLPTPVPERATLTVVKQVFNDNGGHAIVSDFVLSVTDSDANSFVVTSGQSNQFLPGAYQVGETGGPNGYAMSFGGNCDSQGQITIEANNSYTCIIINNDIAPKLNVIKIVDNTGGGTAVASDFEITVNGTSATPSEFAGSQTGTEVTLNAGSYSVVEETGDLYQDTYSADCTDSIGLNETRTCTVTNTFVPPPPPAKGRLTVTKVVINDDGTGTAVVSDFILSVTDSGNNSFVVQSGVESEFSPGNYAVGESGPTSTYTAIFSGDCTAQGQVVIASNATSACTITNNDKAPENPPCTQNCGGGEEEQEGTLIVKKIVVNDNEGTSTSADFTLFVKLNSVDVSGSPTAGSASGTLYTLAPGEYVVSETANSNYTTTFSGDCNSSGVVTVVDDQEKTCIITNNDIAQDQPPCTDCGGGENPPPAPPPPPPTPSPSPTPTPPPPGGGGGGSVIYNFGGGGGGTTPPPTPTPTPPPQISGGQVVAPPVVLGTTLPRTGKETDLTLDILILLAGLVGIGAIKKTEKEF